MGEILRGQVRAGTWLAFVPEGRGVVVGVFRNTLVMRIGRHQVSLHRRREDVHPLGILVDVPFQELGVALHAPVGWAGGALRIGGREIGLEEGLPGTPSWPVPDVAVVTDNLDKLGRMLRGFGVRSEVGRACLETGTASRFQEPLQTCQRGLAAATFDLSEVAGSFGGGEGATPAFDDFCAGMSWPTGCWVAAGSCSRRRW